MASLNNVRINPRAVKLASIVFPISLLPFALGPRHASPRLFYTDINLSLPATSSGVETKLNCDVTLLN